MSLKKGRYSTGHYLALQTRPPPFTSLTPGIPVACVIRYRARPPVNELTITRPDDWHVHLRDGAVPPHTVRDCARNFRRALHFYFWDGNRKQNYGL